MANNSYHKLIVSHWLLGGISPYMPPTEEKLWVKLEFVNIVHQSLLQKGVRKFVVVQDAQAGWISQGIKNQMERKWLKNSALSAGKHLWQLEAKGSCAQTAMQ